MPDAYGELAAGIAAARERFLAAGEAVAGTVREQILNSWRRSRFSSVDVDRIDPPYRADIDYDNRLVRSAGPVLDRLERELSEEPMTVVLTDPEAWVLDRRSGDRALQRKLDQVSLAPGFSYAEEFVGTNGIGTALEDQSSAWVYGPEHFSARLQALSCAGAVIRNPLRGRVEGVIDLTCWRGEASPLMRALARAVHRRWFPSERMRVLDGPAGDDPGTWIADLRLELGQTTGTIVLRRLDQLDATAAELLAAELGNLGATAAWVVATSATHDLHPALLERFTLQVGVPPLRFRIDDLHELVPFLLDQLAPGSDSRCSPEALQVLLHNRWPGNVEQLQRALGVALGRCRGGRIESADLPAECHTVTRQVLTRMQWIERDAIVDALVEARGNRTQAAAKLGMSRATIYRRINAFGIRLAGLHG